MYAIVEIAGQQFKVEEGKKIFVHRLDAEKESILEFDRVLLIEDNDRIIIGEPVIQDAVVQGKVLEDVRGDKVIVFKKKRRKGYRVRNGHRQNFTHIEIVGINEKGMPKKAAPAKVKKTESDQETLITDAALPQEGKAKEVAVTEKSAGKTVKKEAAAGKSTAKKSAEKKSSAKESAVKKPAGEKTPSKKSPATKSSAKKPSGEKK